MSVWMSAKEEPQKNLYLIFSTSMAAVVVIAVGDRRMNRRLERLCSGGGVIVIICVYLVYSFRLLRPRI